MPRLICSWCVALWCFLYPGALAGVHYERPPCGYDEVQGEVLGLSGYTCSPKCAEGTYDCPIDVPDLANARPQCMLKDVDNGAFCALLCSGDYQCPNGAKCQKSSEAGAGICMYPLSFTDWVRQGNSRKLSLGLPQRADKKLPAAIVQKATEAVQNLKSKFAIPDGDADIVTVKNFLAGVSGASPVAAASGWTGAAMSGSGVVSALSSGSSSAVPQAPQPKQEGSVLGAYRNDLRYFEDRVSEGLPGLEKEVADTWSKIKHLDERNKASELMRGVLEIAVIYLLVGVAYKYQALGARGVDMIPHIGFWMEYPQLVMDGITYSKILVGGLVGIDVSNVDVGSFGKSSSGFEPIGSVRAERDTFANFEPSQL